jgi:nitrogen fixation/metabolism regulation signal transduction histidine kinase
MVDEFSAFARMPAPTMKQHEIKEICRQLSFCKATAVSIFDTPKTIRLSHVSPNATPGKWPKR